MDSILWHESQATQELQLLHQANALPGQPVPRILRYQFLQLLNDLRPGVLPRGHESGMNRTFVTLGAFGIDRSREKVPPALRTVLF